MASKKVNVVVWFMKSAEIDVVKQCCISNLVGLHFDLIYTMPYAMCLNTVSEIFSTLKIEDDKNIISTARFSNVGLVSKEEMVALQNMVANFSKNAPITVGTWQDVAKSYFELSVRLKCRAILLPFWLSTTTRCRYWSCGLQRSTRNSLFLLKENSYNCALRERLE
jgi:hypothetical protein